MSNTYDLSLNRAIAGFDRAKFSHLGPPVVSSRNEPINISVVFAVNDIKEAAERTFKLNRDRLAFPV